MLRVRTVKARIRRRALIVAAVLAGLTACGYVLWQQIQCAQWLVAQGDQYVCVERGWN